VKEGILHKEYYKKSCFQGCLNRSLGDKSALIGDLAQAGTPIGSNKLPMATRQFVLSIELVQATQHQMQHTKK
jgi:hypothetical protein